MECILWPVGGWIVLFLVIFVWRFAVNWIHVGRWLRSLIAIPVGIVCALLVFVPGLQLLDHDGPWLAHLVSLVIITGAAMGISMHAILLAAIPFGSMYDSYKANKKLRDFERQLEEEERQERIQEEEEKRKRRLAEEQTEREDRIHTENALRKQQEAERVRQEKEALLNAEREAAAKALMRRQEALEHFPKCFVYASVGILSTFFLWKP